MQPEKNPAWTHITPNERYQFDEQYQALVDMFAAKYRVSKGNFFEVRVHSRAVVGNDEWWFEDALWMDKVFWVFQKPLRFFPPGEEPWQAWALEPLEHVRVHETMMQVEGRDPYANDQLFLLPCHAGSIAWEETSGGFADNIRYRPEYVPTQQEIDKEQAIEEVKNDLLTQISDVSNDTRFTNNDERAYKTARELDKKA